MGHGCKLNSRAGIERHNLEMNGAVEGFEIVDTRLP